MIPAAARVRGAAEDSAGAVVILSLDRAWFVVDSAALGIGGTTARL